MAYDVVVVGASIAGCTAAALLARGGARVALVERHADPAALTSDPVWGVGCGWAFESSG